MIKLSQIKKEEVKDIIKKYNNGQSINSIAKEFSTHAITIQRILEKNKIELRHDKRKRGSLYVKDGEKLIEWAKAQGRLVTKTELTKVTGTKRLSPSYFIKYPELGQYVVSYEQSELEEYSQKLYNWLKENHIQYKPNDRTNLKVSVTALLLEEYSNIALQIAIKPKCISERKYSENMIEKKNRAHEIGTYIVFLYKKDFENLNNIKIILDSLKK